LLSSAAVAAVTEKETAATATATASDNNCLSDCASKTTVAGADFHVKWFTPESEVDLCGHATVALAGYVHSIGNNSNNEYPRQRYQYWKMQCKSGLLGIEYLMMMTTTTTTTAVVVFRVSSWNKQTQKTVE
jgi:predicted PhzF superfamily epimerase YddE/YHI9